MVEIVQTINKSIEKQPPPAKKRGGTPGAPARFARRGPNPLFLAGGGLFLDGFVDFLNNFNHARTWILHYKMLNFALRKNKFALQKKDFAMQHFAFEGVPTTPRLSNPPFGET